MFARSFNPAIEPFFFLGAALEGNSIFHCKSYDWKCDEKIEFASGQKKKNHISYNADIYNACNEL